MSLAYLLNWYPQPSQTALRREVTALEEMGVPFHRFSLRRYEGELVDENDRRREPGLDRCSMSACSDSWRQS